MFKLLRAIDSAVDREQTNTHSLLLLYKRLTNDVVSKAYNNSGNKELRHFFSTSKLCFFIFIFTLRIFT